MMKSVLALGVVSVLVMGCELAAESEDGAELDTTESEEIGEPAGPSDFEDWQVAEVELDGGTVLRFLASPGGGATVIESGNVDSGYAPVMSVPELQDASPWEVFWATTESGTEVPSELEENHRYLLSEEKIAEKAATPKQGWLLEEREKVASLHLEGCKNALFWDAHCDLANGQYSNRKCFLNRSGNTTWNSARSDRYKIGICVQQGQIHDLVTYTSHNPWGACGYAFPGGTLLNTDVFNGGYFTIVWWAGAGDWWRTFSHKVTEGSAADIYDHGQRWRYRSSCL